MSRKSIQSIKDPIWKEMVTNLRANVIYYRQKNNLTQAELAELSGLNVATIADIEQGKATNPRLESIALLAKALKLASGVQLLSLK